MDCGIDMKRLIFLIILLLTALSAAVGLDGRTVILLVSQHRTGDPKMEAVKAKLLETRDKLGYSTEQMPIVYMGFLDSDTERRHFDRLGFQAFDSPVLCVAEWGNPARFGPKQVINDAIARSATPQHVDFIIDQYLRAIDRMDGSSNTPGPSPDPGKSGIEIINVRFEASGQPLFLTNAAVRIKNNEPTTVTNVAIRFYSKLQESDSWSLMGEKTLERLPSGNFATRDIVGDTRKFNLVNAENSAVTCFYRVEIEYNGHIISEEGKFEPVKGPVGSIF